MAYQLITRANAISRCLASHREDQIWRTPRNERPAAALQDAPAHADHRPAETSRVASIDRRPDEDPTDARQPRRGRPVGAENPGILCDLGILADEAEPVPAENPDVWVQDGWMRTPRRRALLQCPVRPAGVVVIGVLAENEPEMPFAGDQDPVQALTPGTGDPPLGRPDDSGS